MKVTKSYINQLVKEELNRVLSEESVRDSNKFRAPSKEEMEALIKNLTRVFSSEVEARNALLYGTPSYVEELRRSLESGKDINISYLVGSYYAPRGDARLGTLSIQEFKSMIGKPHLTPLLLKLTRSTNQDLADAAADFLRVAE